MIVNLKILLIIIIILIIFCILNKKSDNFYNTSLNLALDSDVENVETIKDSKIKYLTFRNMSLLKEVLNL